MAGKGGPCLSDCYSPFSVTWKLGPGASGKAQPAWCSLHKVLPTRTPSSREGGVQPSGEGFLGTGGGREGRDLTPSPPALSLEWFCQRLRLSAVIHVPSLASLCPGHKAPWAAARLGAEPELEVTRVTVHSENLKAAALLCRFLPRA